MGIPRQEYLSGLPFPSPEDLPDPQIEHGSPALQAVSCIFSIMHLLMQNVLTEKKLVWLQQSNRNLEGVVMDR